MSDVRIRIDGETWLTLEAIGECYHCEVAWLREAFDTGLFGGGRVHAGTVVLRVTVLDRVAQVLRLSRYEGLGFETIVALLGDAVDEAAEPAAGVRR